MFENPKGAFRRNRSGNAGLDGVVWFSRRTLNMNHTTCSSCHDDSCLYKNRFSFFLTYYSTFLFFFFTERFRTTRKRVVRHVAADRLAAGHAHALAAVAAHAHHESADVQLDER